MPGANQFPSFNDPRTAKASALVVRIYALLAEAQAAGDEASAVPEDSLSWYAAALKAAAAIEEAFEEREKLLVLLGGMETDYRALRELAVALNRAAAGDGMAPGTPAGSRGR